MCRWMAYSGSPVLLEDLLYRPKHSLIDQSLHSRFGAETTNGDGFGVGWYGLGDKPAVFHSIEPAWNDRNLRELSSQITSGLVFAHVRASSGGAIQQTNCHPFRHENWLWMHNGLINGFGALKRDLVLDIDPDLYPHIEGSTDSEVFFFLALSLGLRDDPPTAVARAVGLIEEAAHLHGVPDPLQMSVATSDGTTIWAFRYSSDGKARSLFYSTDEPTLRQMYPDNVLLNSLTETSRLVVSEPLGDLPGAWNEVPESSFVVVRAGVDDFHPFVPTNQ
ncbi:MAG: class II glutamine amidotransferase [Actinomycetes bacterium]